MSSLISSFVIGTSLFVLGRRYTLYTHINFFKLALSFEHSVRNSGLTQGQGVWGAIRRHPVPTEAHPTVCVGSVPLCGAIRHSWARLSHAASYVVGRARQSWSVCQNSLSPCGRVPWDLAVCAVGGWVLSNPGFHRDSPPPFSWLGWRGSG